MHAAHNEEAQHTMEAAAGLHANVPETLDSPKVRESLIATAKDAQLENLVFGLVAP
jgi:hypothetical protein